MGAATQESDASETVTPSVSHRVAETQEPVTHSVAETQEPAMAETQQTATAETQEPVADIEIELQELDDPDIICFSIKKLKHNQLSIQWLKHKNQPLTLTVELQELETLDAAAAVTQEPVTGIAVEIEEIETPEATTPHPVAETSRTSHRF